MRWLPLLFLALAPSVAAAWQPNGVRLTGAPREQQQPVLASDGVGGAFVAWIDYRADGPPLNFVIDLYLQHMTAAGQIAPGWPVDGLAIATGPGIQSAQAILDDGSGGVLIVYRDTRVDQGDIYLQRITAAGQLAPGWPAGGVPVGIGPREQLDAQITGDGAGGAYVSWQDSDGAGHSRAFYSHVLSDGRIAPGWPNGGRLFEPSAAWLIGRPVMLATAGGASWLAGASWTTPR